MASRRKFLEKSTQLAAALAAGAATISPAQVQGQQPSAPAKKLHILMRSSWGTGPWGHGNRLDQLGSKMGRPCGLRLVS
jgi:hypothetical protein